MTFPRTFTGTFFKTSPTARKKAKQAVRRERVASEDANKRAAKKRDGYACRFPWCGCKSLGLALSARLESSHDRHKGSGGDPSGQRSAQELLITLCKHRHQDGIISRHKGTLRARYLTPKKNNGPIAWEVDINRMRPNFESRPARWIEVARETAIRQWAPFTLAQQEILEKLASMDW